MSDALQNITGAFKGKFLTEPFSLQQQLKKVKAYIFDWDGVFNNGQKDPDGSSPFNEVDSMGTNLLRFNHFLRRQEMPLLIIISGENNKAAKTLAVREHFHAVYSGFKNKLEALDHLCSIHDLKHSEICFSFDDVLDFSLAERVGACFMVGRTANPLMTDFASRHKLIDYLTACDGSSHAVREIVELITGLNGMYDETIMERKSFSEVYQHYLNYRQQVETKFFTTIHTEITEQTL